MTVHAGSLRGFAPSKTMANGLIKQHWKLPASNGNRFMIIEDRKGQVLVLTLDNAERRNALGMEMRIALQQIFERIEAEADIRAVVIKGAGAHFSAGADITGMNVTTATGARERFRISHKMVRGLVKSSKPIVAAVEGWCVGAGLSLALCCDTIVAASDSRFMASFGKVGLMGDLGLLHTLPARIGIGRARQMVLYGNPMPADEAERIGLVDRISEPGKAFDDAMTAAEQLATAAALPIALSKDFFARGIDLSLDVEREYQPMLLLSDDHREGKAAFLEKRAAEFKGR